MVINERDIRNETVRAAAQAVMAAARTAPKAKGRDMVEVAVVTEEDIERLAETMVSMSGESGMKFLLRDADNIRPGSGRHRRGHKRPARRMRVELRLLRLSDMHGEACTGTLHDERCGCRHSDRVGLRRRDRYACGYACDVLGRLGGAPHAAAGRCRYCICHPDVGLVEEPILRPQVSGGEEHRECGDEKIVGTIRNNKKQ